MYFEGGVDTQMFIKFCEPPNPRLGGALAGILQKGNGGNDNLLIFGSISCLRMMPCRSTLGTHETGKR